ncbi:MAG: thiol protease/hemagglutinin PrtT, partial [Muribaculaceae bacterium]|nr:thiol protease/hemagglutinin PrtT [Muribaculaceae bacterium]
MLGYSESGAFKEGEMSPELKWWLDEYSRQIEYAKENGIAAYTSPATRADRKAISPMVKTRWNQDAPYNGMTPLVNGKHCVTGCVATAMAQVMKFWNYPEIGKGEGTCTVTGSNGTTKESMMLDEQKFDWSNMLDVYTSSATTAQKDAVAYLMKSCGYSVEMNYTSYESGAASLFVARALISNFGYNSNIQYCARDYYTPEEWDNMVYEELYSGRPIVYSGQSTIGGHSFVCDGYSGDGYYHFNWGWGGMSDGYFLLNALDPGSLGIGANGGGYNFYQDIVRGIQPTKSAFLGCSMLVDGVITGEMKGNELTMFVPELINYSGKDLSFALGVKFEPVNGGEPVYKAINGASDLSLQLGYLFQELKLPVIVSTTLANGKYKVVLCCKPFGEKDWIPVQANQLSYNYVIINKNGSKYTVEHNKALTVKVTGGDVVSQLVYNQVSSLSITVSNPTDRSITKSFYPVLCDGITPVMTAEGVTLNFKAGETVTRSFNCVFTPIKGASAPNSATQYKLRFYDPSTFTYMDNPTNLTFYPGFSKDVTMSVGAEPKLITEAFSMPGLRSTSDSSGMFTYYVDDLSKVPFNCTIANKGGYFNNVVSIAIMVPDGAYIRSIAEYSLGMLEIQNDAKGTIETTLDLTGLDDGEYYGALFEGGDFIPSTVNDLSLVHFKVNTTGVDEVVSEDKASIRYNNATGEIIVSSVSAIKSIEVYSLSGKRCNAEVMISGTNASAYLRSLPAGVYVARLTTANGKSHTLK